MRKPYIFDDSYMFPEGGPHATPNSRWLAKLPPETAGLLRKLFFLRGDVLRSFQRFPTFAEVRNQLARLPVESGIVPCFISHRWKTAVAPDPWNDQYAALHGVTEPHAYYWYDYSCVPQEIGFISDRDYLELVLANLGELARTCRMIILREVGDNYYSRGWCFHEWFTAQFTGLSDRVYLNIKCEDFDEPRFSQEVVQAKVHADELICGDLSLLETLQFTKPTDRVIVNKHTRAAIAKCQEQLSKTCLEFICQTVRSVGSGVDYIPVIAPGDVHNRFTRLVSFIRAWTEVLQQVEPVSRRVAMFFHLRVASTIRTHK